ncbi:ATP-binding cassette domain-containing protein [Collinsella sp. AGMB00827]|uniref:ATP-binding cassette domain-containing protein n=1 Tax=Collinsella ureilytica TaxID=2869515 RepID=A0ABS7MI41_9ACTN|nr:energy-coupling factor transporter ATPase [Collinsella urealyticum]MBY4796978.1 ATP-binding cassette domain-containing protein [Collinsella urealyticum]
MALLDSEPTTSVIELDGVSFAYGAHATKAIDGIDLQVLEGEFLGIIGPSGSGKSTLAAALSGAIPHHFGGELYGAVRVCGHDTCEVSLTDISRMVGSVLQDIDTQMVASVVEDELLFGLENFGVAHDEIEARIAHALDTVGITSLRHREIATLSGGQKQKVAIAAILALEPRVLVMDEPTAALDPESSRTVFETLARVNRTAGVTVIVIEQKVALLSRYCKRIAVMAAGKVEIVGTPHEVFSHAEDLRALGVDSPRTVRISNSLIQEELASATTLPALDAESACKLIGSIVEADAVAPKRARLAAEEKQTKAISGLGTSPERQEAQPVSSGAPVICLEDVSFSYGPGEAAVSHLSFEVFPGEILSVIGQNGAGKTTLTKLLNGLLHPSSGVVRVAGMDTAQVSTSELAARVSTLFQNPDRQISKESVVEEVAFGLELTGVERTEAHRRAEVVLARFGLPKDESPFSLSRGQRQMVALASVLVMEPQVVLLDEPTSGLDYRECMTVMETVRELAEQGSAVVMVCHDMEVVSDFADRAVVMADGHIIGAGATAEIFAQPELLQAASVEAPQVVRVSEQLSRTVSSAFAGVSEVSDIVQITRELIDRG